MRVALVAVLLVTVGACGGDPTTDPDGGDAEAIEVPHEDGGNVDAEVEAAAFCADRPDGTPCDDGNACTLDDSCAGGACLGTALDCNDLNPCTTDPCDRETGLCAPFWNTEPCDDGNPCTLGDTCGGGECRSGVQRECTDLDDACNRGECNPLTGACEAQRFPDGRACDDGDPCTYDESCAAGICGAGSTRDCSFLDNACNAGACDSVDGSCVRRPFADGTPCDDGVECTAPDTCLTGVCVGGLPDADGDRHGAIGCGAGDDCDDSRAAVNPRATEGPVGRSTCFDGLDNDCDTLADLVSPGCDGLDWAHIDRPLEIGIDLGDSTPLVFGAAFEIGATGMSGPMTDLWAEIGIGPLRSDPTDNPAWAWSGADYYGRGGPGNSRDVFAGHLTPTGAGTFSVAYRFTTDRGAVWLHADADGNGAAPPSNGIQTERLGILRVAVNSHLLVTEIVVAPTEAEFIEVHNPTVASIALAGYYLYDAADPAIAWRYWDLPSGPPWPAVRSYDFVAAFPPGASIGPGERVTVATGSAQTFAARHGSNPTFEMRPGTPNDPATPDMVAAFPGSIGGAAAGMLANITETVVLFYWNGATDLVADGDIVSWGTTAEAPDKTGVTRDGPDPDSVPSAYRSDTPVASQQAIAGVHPSGGSFVRADLAETGEPRTDGNGLNGHDETGEDLTATWTVATAATPGT
ncbi:MAG: lamin tail domain-containing protein [Myxococcota bacterium]|nr:lamin tail domain-containing protein [Myxococcota bacterium]